MLRAKLLAAAVAAVASTAGTADASIILELVSRTPEGSGGTRFNYEVDLAPDARLESGDLFTIYDFAGLISGTGSFTFTPALAGLGGTFTITEQLLGITPNAPLTNEPLPVADDAGVVNLSAVYQGPTIGLGEIAETPLGIFSAVSSFSDIRLDNFSFDATTDTGAANDGQPIAGVGVVAVPAAVPEPGSLTLLGLVGLAGGGTVLRRRKPTTG